MGKNKKNKRDKLKMTEETYVINKLPTDYKEHKYIIVNKIDNEYWFWASLDDKETFPEILKNLTSLGFESEILESDKCVNKVEVYINSIEERNQLVEQYYGLISHFFYKYKLSELAIPDYYGICAEALVTAAHTYNMVNTKTNFKTYAYICMRNALVHEWKHLNSSVCEKPYLKLSLNFNYSGDNGEDDGEILLTKLINNDSDQDYKTIELLYDIEKIIESISKGPKSKLLNINNLKHIVYGKLEGKSLKEAGEEIGISRERARQIYGKFVKQAEKVLLNGG